MVKSLRLVDMESIDTETMPEIFKKTYPLGAAKWLPFQGIHNR